MFKGLFTIIGLVVASAVAMTQGFAAEYADVITNLFFFIQSN